MASRNVKRFLVKDVAITVAALATSGVSSADRELVNGIILGYYPTANQDQLVDNIALTAATGVVTVTLAAGATGINYFTVVVMVQR